MALTRAEKTEKVKKLASELEHSTSAIIGTFNGLTASKDFELRKTVRGAGGSYHVVKNKLAARAAEGTKIEAALQGSQGRLVGCLHLGRSGCAGQGALHLGQGQRGVHLQAGHRRRQGDRRSRDRRTGHHAGQGRALLEAPLPDQLARTASGDGHQRHRPRSRGRHQPGRREGQVCRSAAAPAAAGRRSSRGSSSRGSGAAEAGSRGRSRRMSRSRRQASSPRARRSRRTPPHRRVAKPPTRTPVEG